MGKVVKKVVSFAAPIIGNIIAPGIGGIIGGALGAAAGGGDPLMGALGGVLGNVISGGSLLSKAAPLSATTAGAGAGSMAGGSLAGLDALSAFPDEIFSSAAGGAASAAPAMTSISGALGAGGEALGSTIGGGTPLFSQGALGGAIGEGAVAGGIAPAAAGAGGGGFLEALGGAKGLLKTGLGVAKNLYQAQQQEKMMQQMQNMADPNAAARAQAIASGNQALANPYSNPLYKGALSQAEKAMKRRQAASGGYYSGGALEQAAQLPADVAARLQAQQIQGAGQVAGAAQPYGMSAAINQASAAGQAGNAYTGDLFNIAEDALENIYR